MGSKKQKPRRPGRKGLAAGWLAGWPVCVCVCVCDSRLGSESGSIYFSLSKAGSYTESEQEEEASRAIVSTSGHQHLLTPFVPPQHHTTEASMAATTATATTEAGRRLRDMLQVLEKVSKNAARKEGGGRTTNIRGWEVESGGWVLEHSLTHSTQTTSPSPSAFPTSLPLAGAPSSSQPRPQKLQAFLGPGGHVQHGGAAAGRAARDSAATTESGTSGWIAWGWVVFCLMWDGIL